MSRHVFFGEKGFTLIELVIVIVIMGVAIALAVPKIGGSLEKMKLRSATRKLSAVMRYTRQMAISRKKEYGVVIKGHGYRYLKVTRKMGADQDGEFDSASGEDSAEGVDSATGNSFSDKGISEKPVEIDLCKELGSDQVSLSYQSAGEEDKDLLPDEEEGRRGEIIFYPKGESSGGKVTLAMKGTNLAFQIEVDPVTGRVVVKRKAEDE